MEVEREVAKRDRLERAVRDHLERAVAKQDKDWLDEVQADIDLLDEREERFAMAAVVFSAMTLEALINDYAICNFTRTYFENYRDWFRVRTKWRIFPQLVTGKTMGTEGQTFQGLTKLFSLRNDLVHFKATEKKHPVGKNQASDAIETVRKAVDKLKARDGKVSTDWLKGVEDTVEGASTA